MFQWDQIEDIIEIVYNNFYVFQNQKENLKYCQQYLLHKIHKHFFVNIITIFLKSIKNIRIMHDSIIVFLQCQLVSYIGLSEKQDSFLLKYLSFFHKNLIIFENFFKEIFLSVHDFFFFLSKITILNIQYYIYIKFFDMFPILKNKDYYYKNKDRFIELIIQYLDTEAYVNSTLYQDFSDILLEDPEEENLN